MARDRQDQNSFDHSPFKSLKGLSVSREEQPRPTVPAPSPPPPAVPDDSDLFTQEMAWLNVRPVAGKAAGQAADGSAALTAESSQPIEDGAAEFLAALGKLDKNFQDELPAADEQLRARPRRMKQLERGVLRPDGELDLHGLIRDEAVARTRSFLAHAVRQKWSVVVIVTGKGLHSAEGPVLRRAVEQLLAESRELVLEWGESPRRLGGAGALVVFVRGIKSEK